MSNHPNRSKYQFSITRAASNAWALDRTIWNEVMRSWMEQPTMLYSSKAAAEEAGKEWRAWKQSGGI